MPLYLAVQNGMTAADVAPFLPKLAGLFVGGDDPWKLATMSRWSELAHAHGMRCHVGRINSVRRIMLCRIADADSFDGSGVSRYADKKLPSYDAEVQQYGLEFGPIHQRGDEP